MTADDSLKISQNEDGSFTMDWTHKTQNGLG